MNNLSSASPRSVATRSIGILLTLLATALAACSPDDPFIPTHTADTTGYKGTGAFLRVVHAVVNGPQTDVYIDTAKFFDAPQSYLGFSSSGNNAKYYPVDYQGKRIEFRAGGSAIASKELKLDKGGYYTAYFYGKAGGPYDVLLTTDTVFPQATSLDKSVRYRVVNLSYDAPALDIHQDARENPAVVTGLAYGTASSYVPSKDYPFGKGTGLFITQAGNPDLELLKVPQPLVPLPAGTTWTIIFTGVTHPSGDDPYLLLSALQESFRGGEDSLYGAVPFSIPLTLIRFVNLVATDTMLDVSFYNNTVPEFAANSYFRHNLEGQRYTVDRVRTNGYDSTFFGGDTNMFNRYFSVSLLQPNYSYRIEIHNQVGSDIFGEDYDFRVQQPLTPLTPPTGHPFMPQAGKRYTIVAYGPYAPGVAGTNVLLDNTTRPPAGMAQVRLFHGAFGAEYEGRKLRLRIGSAVTPTGVGYGEATEGTNSIAVPPGTPTVSVIDENGTVIYTQELTNTPLSAGRSYTIFLSRGRSGTALYLHAISEELS